MGMAGFGSDANHHDFIPEALAGRADVKPIVHMLYRPGHYDILYPIPGKV